MRTLSFPLLTCFVMIHGFTVNSFDSLTQSYPSKGATAVGHRLTFQFVSQAFSFERAAVQLFRLHYSESPETSGIATLDGKLVARGDGRLGEHSIESRQLANEVVNDIEVATAGPVEVLLSDLVVRRKLDGRRYSVAPSSLSATVSEEALRTGVVVVEVDAKVIMTIRVEDSDGARQSNVTLGVVRGDAAFDVMTDAKGEVSLLGIVGRYRVKVASTSRPSAVFDVLPSDSGERLVVVNSK